MTFTIIIISIFSVSTITAFGMLLFRSWEIRTSRVKTPDENLNISLPDLPFRHLEKIMLYLTKHIIQTVVLAFAKCWFTILAKIKKWLNYKWPKISSIFKKNKNNNTSYRHSFIKKALLESKAKIKYIKEKVREEHGEKEKESPEEERQYKERERV